MKQTVNEYDFRRAFETLRPDNFSHEGLGLLFEYFEDYEDSTGEEMELDVIAICCDWAESPAGDIVSDFGITADLLEPFDADTYGETVLAYLQDQTSVAGLTDSGTIVYQSF